MRGGYFGDIHWGEAGGDADCDAADESHDEEGVEGVERACSVCRCQEYECGYDEQGLAAETVGEEAGDHRADETAREGDAHCQALLLGGVGDAEVNLVKGFRSSDYDPVVAEQQSTHRRYDADEVDESFVEFFHVVLRFWHFVNLLQNYSLAVEREMTEL